MNLSTIVRSAPIDDFLAGGGTSSGDRWEAVGAGLGMAGTLLAVGVIVLLATSHRGARAEINLLLLVAMAGGASMFGGAALEVSGTAEVLDLGWFDALETNSSGMLRLLGGLLLLLGLGDESVPIVTADERTDQPTYRWTPGAASAFGVVGALLGVLSFAFDGHTVTEGPRVLHALVNAVHATAGGVWFGGLVGLAVLTVARRGPIGPTLVAFARVATFALVAVAAAGLGLILMIVDDPGQLTGTAWGRRLVAKVVVVAMAAALGAYHHLRVVPRLATGAEIERLASRTIVLEALLLAMVVVITALLSRASIV